ncbi:MAG: hypothetical protein JNK63_08815 [Chthonomonas sp.]|nr:hypothetical protein [Chthonomonas sp.]
MEPQKVNDPDPTGRRILLAVISFAGLSIVAFGAIQLFSGQMLTGSLILFIGISDLIIMGLFYRSLK